MAALLLVAHGSRREASNQEVRELTAAFRKDTGEQFESIDCAFLELASPSIPEGISECVSTGASELIVLPYFLSAGRHVSQDIPAIVAEAQQQYPDISIRISPHLGSSLEMIKALTSLVKL